MGLNCIVTRLRFKKHDIMCGFCVFKSMKTLFRVENKNNYVDNL